MRRYPGITPFRATDAPVFKGRSVETQEVSNLILSQKTLILFAKSGMGKTSLLNAGVMPNLKRYGLFPVFIRFNQIGSGDNQDPVTQFMTQYRETHELFSASRARAKPFSPQPTLWRLLAYNPFVTRREVLIPTLIFDQFEEFFRTYPKPEQRVEFLKQLAELLSDAIPLQQKLPGQPTTGEEMPLNLRVVFSIRSDMLNLMQEVSDYLPFVMRTRYELSPMTYPQATQAIREPGLVADGPYETGLITFPDAVVNDILTGLKDHYSDEIESFQLQLVCSYLEDNYIREASGSTPPPSFSVKTDDYGGVSGIQNINSVYFSDTINTVAEQTSQSRPVIITELIKLLNDAGNRILGEDSQLDLPTTAKDALVDRRLLKRDKIQGNTYYEVSHDKIALALEAERNMLEEEQKQEKKLIEEGQRKEQEAKAALERRRKFIINTVITVIGIIAVLSGTFAWKNKLINDQLNAKNDSLKNSQTKLDTTLYQVTAARDSVKRQSDELDKNNKKLGQTLRDLNLANLQKAQSDFKNAKSLMKGYLFIEAANALRTIKIPANVSDYRQEYRKLSKEISQTKQINKRLIPLQKMMEKANCLEEEYYLRCAYELYVKIYSKQNKFDKMYQQFYYPKKYVSQRIKMTDSTTREYAYMGFNRGSSPISDLHIIKQKTPCNCTKIFSTTPKISTTK